MKNSPPARLSIGAQGDQSKWMFKKKQKNGLKTKVVNIFANAILMAFATTCYVFFGEEKKTSGGH